VIKWTAIVGGALLALGAVCGLLLRLLFDPNDYRTRIELAFNERTGRVLELEGKLGLRLLPQLAVSTGPFSVSERADAGEGEFITAQDARLGLALLPLLRRRVELGELVLIEPVVALRIDTAGRNNWSDLFERPAPPAEEPEAETGASPIRAFRIDGVVIKRGRLSLEDARRPRRLQLSDLELEASPLAAGAATTVRASFALEDGERVLLRSVLKSRVGRTRPGFWTLEDLASEIELPPRDGAPRSPTQARVEVGRLTADIDGQRYSAPELRYRLGNARGEASLEAHRGDAGLTVSGPITLERTDLRSLLSALGITLPSLANSQAPGAIELKAALRCGPGIALRDIVAVVGDTRLTGSVEVGAGPGAPLKFDLRGDRLELDDYLPVRQSGAAQGAAASGQQPGGKDRLRTLDASGRLAFGRATVAGVELADLDARVVLRRGTLELDPLSASVFGGSSQTRLRYELAAPVPRLTLEQRLVDVDTGALMDQLLKQRRVGGRGTLSARLTGRGRGRPALLASLSGPFDVRVRDGRVNGVDVWGEIERAVAAARGSTPPRPSSTPYTPFDRFEAAGYLEGRVIRNDRLEVSNPQLRARGSGTIDYGSGALDLALTARLLEAPQGTVAGVSLDRVVGVDIPLTVKGKVSEPRVRPDVGRLIEAAARQQLQKEGENLEKKLKDKLDETLKDLLGQ
jgi:AsmA protein